MRTLISSHGFAAAALSAVWPVFLAGIQQLEADDSSLWLEGSRRSLYSTDTAPDIEYTKNDLIHVIVDETGTARNNANTNLRRKFDLNAELTESATLHGLSLEAADPTTLPSLDLKTEKRQEGRGTTDRNERVSFRITTRVIEVKPNGNLIIEGRTTRLINDEESILTIFGEVNPDDIEPKSRSIRSERIADLKLGYSGQGTLSRNMGRTFLSWLLEWVWPF